MLLNGYHPVITFQEMAQPGTNSTEFFTYILDHSTG